MVRSSMFMLSAIFRRKMRLGGWNLLARSRISPSASTPNKSCGGASLSEAQRLSHTGSWASDPAIRKHTYWSEEMFRITGFDSAGGPPRFEEFERRVHSDDRARTKERFRTAIRERVDFDHVYRIVHPGG